ncbi:MarR family transcriptional regulator [Sphingobium lignivorans]|uniref:MarR family transcriptional regulator for hemolysin n=1 Tax=Sphingobium lignivorans TaxID=2735886 RepID=A0ABR6NHP7_9SPHN|nr:MarR family transcriptional regulator for hemolysin [Sphingobium lignivorans]
MKEQRRTKKAEGGESPEQSSGVAKNGFYGGYPKDQAERHLRNFYTTTVPDAQDVFNFRTTRALVVAGRRWRKLANDRLKPIGQNMARWETLYLMASSEEEISQGELARVVGVEGPTMVSMLNSLARDELIDRYQSKIDRRITHNRITEKGIQVAQNIMAITNKLRSEVLRDIDPAKLAVTLEVLEQIHFRLDELS